jgi:NAD(P)-dependent dehydrogenase (short-subunit alcohol dehydrogenase family)
MRKVVISIDNLIRKIRVSYLKWGMNMEKRIALITGASGGFGLLTSIELAKSGIQVVAGVQDLSEKDIVLNEAKKQKVESLIDVVKLDITVAEEIENLKDYIFSTYKTIDIVVNIAGYSAGGPAEDISLEDYKKQFDVNLFGTIAVTKAFIPYMRENRKGKIINMGSISGTLAFPGLSPYASSKFALRGFSESLRLELLPFNVYVCLLEPGTYKTPIWEKGLEELKDIKTLDDYQPMIEFARKGSKMGIEKGGDPIEVANIIKKLSIKEKPSFYHPIGKDAKGLVRLKKKIPWFVTEYFLTKGFVKKLR